MSIIRHLAVFLLLGILNKHSRQWTPEGIWKRNFVSAVLRTVHNKPDRKRSFWKTLYKPEDSENDGFVKCGRKSFSNRNVDMAIMNKSDFPAEFSSTINRKLLVVVAIFLRRSVDGKHFMRFQIFAGVKWTSPTKTILVPKKVYATIDTVCLIYWLIDWLTGHPPPSSSYSSSPDTSGDTPVLRKRKACLVSYYWPRSTCLS